MATNQMERKGEGKVRLRPDVVEKVEDWRATQRPIPAFAQAVAALIKRGAEVSGRDASAA